MFITRVLKKNYFNKLSSKNIRYNIEEYYKNFNVYYFADFFSYHINNEK